MNTKIPLLALCIFNIHLVYAQITPTPAPTYFVSKGADVQVTTSSIWHSEESIAIDMNNPLSLIISANTDIVITRHNHNHSSQGIWTSSDGGNTWSGSDQLPNDGQGACDPSCVFDAEDQGYVLGLGKDLGRSFFGVNVQTTGNDGVSWSPQVEVNEDNDNDDKPMSAAVDVSGTSPYTNFFYTVFTNDDTNNDGTDIKSLQIIRSTDGGLTFSTPLTLKTGFGHGANVQTGPNGEVYVCWADYTNETSTTITPGNYIAFASDISNGGSSFTTATDIIKETGAPVISLSPDNTDNGIAAFNYTRMNDFPSMAVDKGCGPNNHPGRIYIAYSDGFDAGQNLIKVTYSDDNGSTWQSSTTVSTNPSFIQSWFPAIAVDATTGLVNVVYYSIDNTSPAFNTNTYVSYSTDGGYTWQTIKASDASHVTSQINGTYAGDYISICSYNGNSYATWHDNRSGQWQVYVAKISYSAPISYSRQNNMEVNASNLMFTGTSTNEVNFQAENDLISPSNGLPLMVPYGVTYTAGNEIILEPGFEASSGVIGSYFYGGPNPSNTFIAQIKATNCETPGLLDVANFKSAIIETDTLNHIGIYCYPNPTANHITFGFNDYILGPVTLQIKNINGQMIQSLPVSTQANGKFQYDYNCNGLSAGVYFFTLLSSEKTVTSKFIKLN